MSRQQQSQSANWINDARRRLAAWRGKRPETKAGQIWALWPEIKVALDDGHTVNSIRVWLKEEAEITIGTDTLRSYLSRFRAKEARQQDPSSPHRAPNAGSAKRNSESNRLPILSHRAIMGPAEATPDATEESTDPMAGARKALNKTRFDIRKIHGDGDPSDRNLI